MASTKKKTNTKTKKNTSKKASPKKKRQKKVEKRYSYSLLVIIALVLLVFYYLNKRPGDKDQISDLQNQSGTGITLSLDEHELSYYYPTSNLSNGGLVEHLAYSLDYNEEAEQADWVFYELTKDEVLSKEVNRKDNFQADPSINISSALPNDYYKSGYDRGHLCPAADNRWSKEAMDESFYMSNMSPQAPQLNRQIWAKLEDQVREWAVENEKLYIATGPILADGFKEKIGKSQVSVPNYFYKVIADLSGEEIKGVAFIFSNGENNGELKYYAFPIDMIEERTKIDFFYKLDDDIENKIESDFNLEEWFQ